MAHWALVVGGKGQDKTAAIRRLIDRLTAVGVTVAGFFQEGVYEDSERIGFRVLRVAHRDSAVLARRGASARSQTEEAFCSITFDNAAFSDAFKWLQDDQAGARILLLDEISKFEVAGKGHYSSVLWALASKSLVILSIRADQLFYVVDKLQLTDPIATLDLAESGELDDFVSSVTAALSKGSQ